jgi:sporulation protein YlmC with PRC-barrel domain
VTSADEPTGNPLETANPLEAGGDSKSQDVSPGRELAQRQSLAPAENPPPAESVMKVSLVAALGRQVVSRATAETLGQIRGVVIDVPTYSVSAWQINKGRKAVLVDHEYVTGLGGAALVVDDEEHLRDAVTPEEVATIKGQLVLLGALVLSDAGNELGHVADATIDPVTAQLSSIQLDEMSFDAAHIRGFGSYALVAGLG